MASETFEEPMVAVSDHPTEADARHVAGLLVENGVGATIESATIDETDGQGPPSVTYRVMVLSHQQVRAEEALGLRDPADRTLADPDEPMKIDKKQAPWKLFAVIWLVAMVTVPAAAFLITVFLMGR